MWKNINHSSKVLEWLGSKVEVTPGKSFVDPFIVLYISFFENRAFNLLFSIYCVLHV